MDRTRWWAAATGLRVTGRESFHHPGAGVDVLVRFSGASIGRLGGEEVESIEMDQSRRGLMPSRHRSLELAIRTDQGQARFELPGLAESDLRELTPYLARTCAALRPD